MNAVNAVNVASEAAAVVAAKMDRQDLAALLRALLDQRVGQALLSRVRTLRPEWSSH